jgi:hypothetical protein
MHSGHLSVEECNHMQTDISLTLCTLTHSLSLSLTLTQTHAHANTHTHIIIIDTTNNIKLQQPNFFGNPQRHSM